MYKVIGGDGKEYGPADVPTLESWVRAGNVTPNTVLIDVNTGQQLQARQLLPLRPLFGMLADVPPAVPPPPPPVQPPISPYSPSRQEYPAVPADVRTNSGKATTSLVLGLVGLLAWFIPLVGLPITVLGLVTGIPGLRSSGRSMAIAGIVLSIIGLFLTIVNASVGAYLGATGQHPLINPNSGQ